MKKLYILCMTALGITGSAFAGAPLDVAIVAADGAPGLTDVQTKLVGTGFFNSVTVISAETSTPTLAQLQAFDSIITWSNGTYQDAIALGNVFADYVDAGGGVVVGVFANSTTTAGRSLTGRWTPDYDVIVPRSGNFTGQATLGTVLVPSHDLMTGVTTFDGGTSSFRPTTTAVTAGSTRIAEWSDGRTLLAVGANFRRVDLGFFPVSNAVSGSSWLPTTDGATMMGNALMYTAGVPEPGTFIAVGSALLLLAVRRRRK